MYTVIEPELATHGDCVDFERHQGYSSRIGVNLHNGTRVHFLVGGKEKRESGLEATER